MRRQRISKKNRGVEGSGELLLPDGTVAVTGWGCYLKMPLEKIAACDHQAQEWRVVPSDRDPEFVDL